MAAHQFRTADFPNRVPRGSACLSCRRRKMVRDTEEARNSNANMILTEMRRCSPSLWAMCSYGEKICQYFLATLAVHLLTFELFNF